MKEGEKHMKESDKGIIMPRDLPIPVDKFNISPELLLKAESVTTKHEFPSIDDCHLWVSLGPKNSEEQISEIISLPCVTTIRMNSQKYSSVENLLQRVNFIRSKNRDIKICIDLSGPKIRTSRIDQIYGDDSLDITKGQRICFIDESKYQQSMINDFDDIKIVLFNNSFNLPLENRDSGFVLASDGWQQFSIEDGNQHFITCRALHNCKLFNGRGISMSGMYDNVDPVTDEVKELIKRFATCGLDPDYLGLSFVNKSIDVDNFRRLIKSYGLKSKIISKIETLAGVNNIDEISHSSELIMLARGDLAVELAHLGADTLIMEDKVRESCNRNSKECVIATRVADYLAEGGRGLAVYEKARIIHELSLRKPVTLMMANETMNDPSAVPNTITTLNTIASLT